MKTNFRTFLLFIALLLVTNCAFADSYSLFVNKADGNNSLSGRTYDLAWKDFGFAISEILKGDYSSTDVVTLYLTNGPYHLGEEITRLPEDDFTVEYIQLERDRDGIPELIIVGWDNSTSTEKEQIITGINNNHRLEYTGSTESTGSTGSSAHFDAPGNLYTYNWRPEAEYNFGWQRGATPAAIKTYVGNNPGNKTLKWVSMTVEGHLPNESADNTHFGIYMIRREMVVGINKVTGDYYNFKPLYNEFIAEARPVDNYYNLDYYIDPSEYEGEEWSIDYLSNETKNESFKPYSEWDVTINTSLDLDPATGNVEIYAPILRRLFTAERTERIELRSLSFRFANPYPRGSAIYIERCDQVKITNSSFKHIGGVGLNINHCSAKSELRNWWSKEIEDNGLWDYEDVYLQNVVAEDCGIYGIALNQCVGVTMENCTLEGNNWLAYRAGTMVWACGALKAFQIHHVRIEGGESKNNYGFGFWIDQDGRDITFNDYSVSGNYSAGLFLEISPGPINIIGGELINNGINTDQSIGSGRGVGPRCGLLLNSVSNLHIQGLDIDQSGVENSYPVRVSATQRIVSEDGGMVLLWGNSKVDQYMENNRFSNITFNAPIVQEEPTRFISTTRQGHFLRYWQTVDIESPIWKRGGVIVSGHPEQIKYWYEKSGKQLPSPQRIQRND